MNRSPLFTNQTGVVQLLCALVLGAVVLMGANAGAQVLSVGGDTTCSEALKAVAEAEAGIANSCDGDQSCISTNMGCSGVATPLGADAMAGASPAETCRALIDASCSDLGSYDSAMVDKKEAGVARTESMKTKEKANEEFQKAQTDAQTKQQEAAKQMVELRQQYRDKRKEMMDKNEEKLTDANKAKMAAVKEAQEQLDKIDTEYIGIRDSLRQAADKISNGELQWKVGCRSSAYAESAKVQQALDEATIKEQQAVNSINNSSSNLFGLRYRRLNKKRQRIADRYNEVLTRCLKGEIDPGASKKVEIDQARLQLASMEKKSQDLDVQMKQRQANIKKQLEDLQKSTDDELAKAATRLKRDLEDADSDFQQNMQLLQQQQAMAQQNANKGQEANLRKLEQADRELQQANREQALANNRAQCIAQTKGRSSKGTSTSDIRAIITKGTIFCPKLYGKCSDDNSAEKVHYEKVCGQLNFAKKNLEQTGSARRSGSAAPTAQ